MSLYREAGARRKTVVIGAAIALLVALIGGFVLGRASVGEPKAQEVVERLRTQLEPVANGLELLPNEYEQAQAGSGAEGVGVKGNVDRIETSLRGAMPDLDVLDPDGAKELEGAVSSLAGAVGGNAPPAQVKQLAAAASSALARVPGGE